MDVFSRTVEAVALSREVAAISHSEIQAKLPPQTIKIIEKNQRVWPNITTRAVNENSVGRPNYQCGQDKTRRGPPKDKNTSTFDTNNLDNVEDASSV